MPPEQEGRALLAAAAAPPALPRLLEEGDRGRDVVAIKRALVKAGFRAPTADRSPRFDAQLTAEVSAFQDDRGLDVDGRVGNDTLGALAPYLDAYGRWLLAHAPVAPAGGLGPTATTRQRIVGAARLGVRNAGRIAYSQKGARRWDGIANERRPPEVPRAADCSSFVTWCWWTVLGGGDDVLNGQAWEDGYTGTLADHGVHVPRAHLRPGDLVFYGDPEGPQAHVALVLGHGDVASHGGVGGPFVEPLGYRADIFDTRTYLPS